MICTKCNSIIPDEAKFCPSCGANCKTAPAAQTVSEKKCCEKCGLELEANAKFCPVCGTAVSGVSLNKRPDSDSLVSAMPSSVPTPTAVAAPSAGTAPYAPPADAIPSGFGEPAPMPQYAPPAGGFGDMGSVSSAAAAVAVPVKKKNGAKVAIIIAAAVVVLLAATAILFFTNKATFLSTFMGKSKYAAMVEGTSVKETARKIDVSAISNSVKSVSEAYGSLAAVNSSNSIMPTMYSSYATAYGRYDSTIDIESLIKTYNQILADTYGTDAIKVTGGAQVDLTDAAKTAIGGADLNEVLDIINGTTFTYDIAASEKALGAQLSTEGKIAISARVLVNEDGSCYLAFPFASDKALMFKIDSDSAETEAASKTVSLELDEKEISRLIEEIVKIYLSHYEKAVTDMGNGSLTVDGTEVSGKLITANFSGDAMTELVKEIITHIGNDEYFSGKIVEFVTECGGELTLAEYKKKFEDAANEISIPVSAKFSVKTVIDRNGNVLAKSYTTNVEGKEGEVEFAYKGGEKDFAAQFIYDVEGDKCTVKLTSTENGFTGSLVADSDGDVFTVKADCVKTDSKSGSATITFQENDDGEYKFNISYSGVETVKSFNRDVCVGTVNVTVNMPKGFDAIGDELLTVLDGMQFTISNTADATSQSVSLSVKTTAYGDASVYATVTATDSGSALAVPGSAIDLSGAMTGNIDAETEKQLEEFYNEVMEALKKINIFSDSIPSLGGQGSTPLIPPIIKDDDNDPWNINFNDNSHASDDFDSMSANELSELSVEYVLRFAAVSEYGEDYPELESKLYEAQDILTTMSTYMSAFDSESERGVLNVSMLREWRKALKKFVIVIEECELLVTSGGNAPGASHANDDFSTLTPDELEALVNEYCTRLYGTLYYFADNPALKEKWDEADDAYDAMYDYYWDYVFMEKTDEATLNNWRNGVRNFVTLVEQCEALNAR